MNIDWPNLILGGLFGWVLGFSLDRLILWSRKVKVIYEGIESVQTNIGQLYKVAFSLKGNENPGKCSCEITVGQSTTYAKWDESPNPLIGDRLEEFAAEKVPDTFFQDLYLGKGYGLPILIREKNQYYVFDAWWFGKEKGYYNKPPLSENDEIKIVIRGERFLSQKNYTLREFIAETK